MNENLLVIHVGTDEVRLAHADVLQGVVKLSDVCSFFSRQHREDGGPLSDSAVLDALASLVQEKRWRGSKTVWLLSGSKVACQSYDMPPLQGGALRQAVLLKLGQQLHFDVAESVVAVDPVGETGAGTESQMRVTATAAHRSLTNEVSEAAARVGLDVAGISAGLAALAKLAAHTAGEASAPSAVLYVDEHASTLTVLDAGAAIATAELPVGLDDFVSALMRPIIVGDDVVQLEQPQALALRNDFGVPAADESLEPVGITGERVLPLIEPVLQKFAKNLTQWLTFAATSLNHRQVECIRLVGPGSTMPRLAEALGSRISREVQAEDWLDLVVVPGEETSDAPLQSMAVAVAGALFHESLPDLMPSAIRKKKRLRKIRRVVTLCGPCAAAATLVLAMLFERVGSQFDPALAFQNQQLAGVQQIVGANSQWNADRAVVSRLQRQFDEFSQNSPSWVGVFKDLATLLPSELQVTDYVVSSREDGLRLTVNAMVFSSGQPGRDFDKTVAQTLLLLQKSPSFGNVQLLSANRDQQSQRLGATGALSVELELVYPSSSSKV